jgi:hypothetical protein
MKFAAFTLGALVYLLSFKAPAQQYPYGYYPMPQPVSMQQRQYLRHLPQTVVMRRHMGTGQTEFHHAQQLIYPNPNMGYQVAHWNFQNASYGQFQNYGYPWQFSYYAYPYRGYMPPWYNQYPMWNYWNNYGYNYYTPYYGNQWYVPTYNYGGYNYAYQYYYYYNWGGYTYYFYRSPWWW